MQKDTPQKLSAVSVVLHWVIGIAVIAMLASGIIMTDVLQPSPVKWQVYGIHKSIGIIVLVFASVRILWRLYNGMPKPLQVPPRWQKILAHAVHGLLLIATLSMPISGIAMNMAGGRALQFFGWELIAAGGKNPVLAEIANTVHAIGGKVFIALIVIHLLAAVKHHFIDKNAIVKRILGMRV